MTATVTSITFTKAAYQPGDTVTATVTYTPGTEATDYTAKATLTVGSESASATATFTVDAATAPTLAFEDSGAHVWTKASTTGRVATFTTTLPSSAPTTTVPPPSGTPQPVANPAFSGSTDEFTWPSNGTTATFRVQANAFSMVPGATIAVAGDTYADWGFTINVPSRTTGAVAAYPDVSTWTQIPGPSGYKNTANPLLIKDLTALSSSWSHGMPVQPGPHLNSGSYTPQNYQAEAAYDIFVRPPNELGATTDHHEVMLWTDLSTRLYKYLHQFVTLPTIDGIAWQGWATPTSVQTGKAPKDSTAKWELILIPTTPTSGEPVWRTSGSVTILAVFDALVAVTWLSETDELSFVQYGFEINTTRGKPLTFRVYDYSLDVAFTPPAAV